MSGYRGQTATKRSPRLGIEAKFVDTNVTTEGLDAFAALVAKGQGQAADRCREDTLVP